MKSYKYIELDELAKRVVYDRYMPALQRDNDGMNTFADFREAVKSWDFTKQGDRIYPQAVATGVCNHCGGAMVDGMCDAPLSSAD